MGKPIDGGPELSQSLTLMDKAINPVSTGLSRWIYPDRDPLIDHLNTLSGASKTPSILRFWPPYKRVGEAQTACQATALLIMEENCCGSLGGYGITSFSQMSSFMNDLWKQSDWSVLFINPSQQLSNGLLPGSPWLLPWIFGLWKDMQCLGFIMTDMTNYVNFRSTHACREVQVVGAIQVTPAPTLSTSSYERTAGWKRVWFRPKFRSSMPEDDITHPIPWLDRLHYRRSDYPVPWSQQQWLPPTDQCSSPSLSSWRTSSSGWQDWKTMAIMNQFPLCLRLRKQAKELAGARIWQASMLNSMDLLLSRNTSTSCFTTNRRLRRFDLGWELLSILSKKLYLNDHDADDWQVSAKQRGLAYARLNAKTDGANISRASL